MSKDNRMNKYYLAIIIFLLAPIVRADSLDGLNALPVVFTLVPIGLVCLLLLVVSSILRFTTKPYKLNKTLNYSGLALIIVSLMSVSILGIERVREEFLAVCGGLVLFSGILISLNILLVDKEDKLNESN